MVSLCSMLEGEGAIQGEKKEQVGSGRRWVRERGFRLHFKCSCQERQLRGDTRAKT